MPFSLPWLTNGWNSFSRKEDSTPGPSSVVRISRVPVYFRHIHRHVAAASLRSLATIQQKVVEDALHFARIELRGVQPGRLNADCNLVKLRVRPHQFDGAADGALDGSFHHIQRIGRTRQLQQRIDQIGQAVHRNANFQIKLFALLRSQVGISQELGIGQDGSQRMAQVVRNRAGHPANRCQSLSLQQPLLRLMQALAHAGEGIRKLGDLARTPRLYRVTKVSFPQGPDPIH